LGFQSYPQLEATYGIQDAAAITGYCSTWVALRANDTPTAKHVSENLGQVEQVEANEGMSYGVNDMRDGVNLSRMQVTRPLVMHTEVTNLPNLVGFLRFGRNLPVVRFTDSYNALPSPAAAFVERQVPPVCLDPEEEDKSPPKSSGSRSKRRRARKSEAPELPLEADKGSTPAHDELRPESPSSNSAEGGIGNADNGLPRLLGRTSGFRLRQHGRASGDRSDARPA
jgi:hypothetical protein